MKTTKYSFLALAVLLMAACTKDDTPLEWLIDNNPGKVIPPEIVFDQSDLDEGMDIIVSDPTDEAYNDYWENSPWTITVRVNYAPEGATVTSTSSRVKYTIDGGHVTLNIATGRVHVIASGESQNGSLKVYSDNKYKLTLNELTLNNPNGAAINNQCGKSLYVVVAPGTSNYLSDGEEYIIPEEEDMKATIFSEGQMIFSGQGNLSVSSLNHNAIASDDYLRFRKGNKYLLNSQAGNCIRGKDGVFIDGSVFNMLTNGDGKRGITSKSSVKINGGRTTIITNGDAAIDVEMSDTTSCAGIKCDSLMTITGGELRILSTGEGGKGINAHSDILMTGGKVTIVTNGIKGIASPKGVKCAGELGVSSGALYSYSRHASPIDAATLTIAPAPIVHETKTHLFNIEYATAQQ